MAENLTARERRSIKTNRDGFNCRQLAAVYGVRVEHVRRIRFDGHAWNRHGNAKLTQSLADEMRRLKDAGVPKCKLARQFGVSDATVSLVVRNVIWKRNQ